MALGQSSLKKGAAPPFRNSMDDVNSSKAAAEPGGREATRVAGCHPGPLSPTLLEALRAYVRYNQAAIETAFRKALAAATAKNRHFGR